MKFVISLLLDESNYTLVDPESEELFGFKLKRSLQRAQTRQVCKARKRKPLITSGGVLIIFGNYPSRSNG